MVLGVFHNVWDWTAIGTLALAVVGAIALFVGWLTLRQTKAEIALSRKEVEEAHRPLIVPLHDRREINLGTKSGIEKLPALPRANQFTEGADMRTRLLIPIENIGTGPAIRLEADVALDSSEESSVRSLPAVRADGRLFLEFAIGPRSRLTGIPNYWLTVTYEDVAGKDWITRAHYSAVGERYEEVKVD